MYSTTGLWCYTTLLIALFSLSSVNNVLFVDKRRTVFRKPVSFYFIYFWYLMIYFLIDYSNV